MRSAALASSLLLLGACHAGAHDSGNVAHASAQRSYQVGAFDRISLEGSPDVIVAVGGQASVRAEGDSEMMERLEITAENGELKIRVRDRGGWSWGSHRGITVHVTMPALAAASIAGSGDMRIDRVQGQRFAGTISGSADMNIGELRVAEANFNVSGSGGVRAAGAVPRMAASLAGSGDIDLGRLEAVDATLSLAGSGDIGIRATHSAAIQLNGSGDVNVTGPAQCTISKSGSGDARCGG
jgi:hypothetical protein